MQKKRAYNSNFFVALPFLLFGSPQFLYFKAMVVGRIQGRCKCINENLRNKNVRAVSKWVRRDAEKRMNERTNEKKMKNFETLEIVNVCRVRWVKCYKLWRLYLWNGLSELNKISGVFQGDGKPPKRIWSYFVSETTFKTFQFQIGLGVVFGYCAIFLVNLFILYYPEFWAL